MKSGKYVGQQSYELTRNLQIASREALNAPLTADTLKQLVRNEVLSHCGDCAQIMVVGTNRSFVIHITPDDVGYIDRIESVLGTTYRGAKVMIKRNSYVNGQPGRPSLSEDGWFPSFC